MKQYGYLGRKRENIVWRITFSIIFYLAPFFVVYAAPDTTAIETLLRGVQNLVKGLIPVAFGLAVLFFFWGVALYVFSAADEKATERGRRIMIGGILALFVIASIWGIVAWLQTLLGVSAISSGSPPQVNFPP